MLYKDLTVSDKHLSRLKYIESDLGADIYTHSSEIICNVIKSIYPDYSGFFYYYGEFRIPVRDQTSSSSNEIGSIEGGLNWMYGNNKLEHILYIKPKYSGQLNDIENYLDGLE